MYQDQKKSINWKSVLLKLAFLIVVLILIVLLLPINRKEKTKGNSDLFIENMEVLKKTANTYYKEEDLPITDKENLKITLGELVRNGQIRSLRDKDGNTCSEDNSFIKLKKEKEEYKIEVKLICGKEKDTTYLIKAYDDFEKRTTTTTTTTTTKKTTTTTTKTTTKSLPQISETTAIITSKVEVTTTISNLRTVTFVTNSPSKVFSVSVFKGDKVRRPVDPIKIGYEFVGWYKDGSLFDFNTSINENSFIYASWKRAN